MILDVYSQLLFELTEAPANGWHPTTRPHGWEVKIHIFITVSPYLTLGTWCTASKEAW